MQVTTKGTRLQNIRSNFMQYLQLDKAIFVKVFILIGYCFNFPYF